MTEATDKLASDVTTDLAAITAENETLQQSLAAKDAQIADLTAQLAVKPFVNVTITEGTPPHAKLEFFDGQVVEKDVPDGVTLSFAVQLGA